MPGGPSPFGVVKEARCSHVSPTQLSLKWVSIPLFRLLAAQCPWGSSGNHWPVPPIASLGSSPLSFPLETPNHHVGPVTHPSTCRHTHMCTHPYTCTHTQPSMEQFYTCHHLFGSVFPSREGNYWRFPRFTSCVNKKG